MRAVVRATALAAITVLSARVVVADDPGVAAQTVRTSLFVASFLILSRMAVAWFEARARDRGKAGEPTLIIGAGEVGQRTAKRLLNAPELGLHPIGFLDKAPFMNGDAQTNGDAQANGNGAHSNGNAEANGHSYATGNADAIGNGNGKIAVPVPVPVPVLGASWDLDRVVAQHGVRHAIIAFSTAPHEVLLRIKSRCEELGVTVSLVPRLFETMKERVTVEHLGGLALISTEPTNPKSWQFEVKYAIDRIAAAVLLVLLSPLLLAITLGVWRSVGTPILYRQTRVGCDGRAFEVLKFRSMNAATIEAHEVIELPPDTAPGGIEGTDRRTRFGQFLRRTSLDELAQLINVLRGEMSLVGPRPERPEFVSIFERDVHRYADRHRVRAGITGWAQVNGLRGKTSLADRAEWDNYYIDNWSLWLDVKILFLTARALFRSAAE
ncbi:MAG: exopolysaccharide biosynthesis polyprenyl glycosylphosphotransferase [Actinomycetota bacterium]|nr:exopolysaccharide biosynthesis polyprenyl glycosylphosphotransferase [Actinomycetota bacterium]